MINAQPRRKSWRGFILRHFIPLRVRDDPPAEGEQGRPLGLHVLALQEARQVIDPLQQLGRDGVGIQVAADDADDLLPKLPARFT